MTDGALSLGYSFPKRQAIEAYNARHPDQPADVTW